MPENDSVKWRRWGTWGVCAVWVCGAGCSPSTETTQAADAPRYAAVDTARLLAAGEDEQAGQWLSHGRTYEEQRYSPLDEITTQNVERLGLAWFADYDTNLQQQATPLYIDGVLYVSTAWSKVYAFDARTGKTLWQYDPKVPGEWAVNVCCGLSNRGVAAYDGKLYLGTLDGRLVAIDARTGQEVWSVLTVDRSERYSITGAPRVVQGRVLIGNSGAEFGVRGYLSAYDAQTGELDWRFYTVPGNPADGFENDTMRRAAATWTGEWWTLGGGGTVWDSFVYDPVTDLLFIGVGNGSPWNARYRSPEGGDNLFLSSIVAVKPDTGEYVWHYQTTPWETWDYTATQPIVIADLEIDGSRRRVLMQAPKNGFFYVLDAATGKVLRADAYTEVNWADGVDLDTGRPRIRAQARYQAGKPFNALPGPQGAHAWHPMAYSPRTGLVYIPVQRAWFPFVEDEDFQPQPVGYNLGVHLGAPLTYYRDHPDEPRDFVGYLKAWDPVAGREVWRGEENQGPTGGALATAGGLVFQGGGSSQEFRAYDARTGEKLWSMHAQTGVLAGPISYELDGRQYVAVSVGGNQAGGYYAPNYSRLLVFTLDGKAQLPPTKTFVPRPLDPPPATASPEVVAAGRAKYSQYCAACHGENGQTRGAMFPDLTRTPLLHSQERFDQVVLKGALSARGMASFAQVLEPADTQAIRAFIVARANDMKQASAPGASGAPQQAHR
ncbi:MAG: PQQ-dependent dehydrogenase, methanol/ethanol family [Proteobacteria bacterium]|nr:MAG: PQQ-dependent dehydrogenase, methanol/ethanol family [Pseudomonadota bacterium]